MLLKSIKLTNFRQYKSAVLEFSTDREKNITLVTGEMGFGKSTLEQAFRFVLYGKSEFDNDILINSTALEMCEIGKTISTEVMLDFQHLDKNYRCARKQYYSKISYEKAVASKVEIVALEVSKGGNTTPISQIDALTLIDQLIPKELSDYFFVDGEKIEKMTKSIKEEKRQDDFIKVVKSMLGLNHLFDTISHLEKVKASYTRDLVSLGGNDSTDLERKISESEIRIQQIQAEIEKLERDQELYRIEMETLDRDIKLIPNAQELQIRYNRLDENLPKLQRDLQNAKIDFFRTDRSFAFYIANPLMKKAMKMLEDEKIEDKGVPNLHATTLEYLLQHETCLCGQHYSKDSQEYKNLKELLNYVPPQSIGLAVTEFKKMAASNFDYFSNVQDILRSTMLKVISLMDSLETAQNEKDILSKQIQGINKAADSKARYDFVSKQYKGIFTTIGRKNHELSTIQMQKKTNEQELQKMAYKIDSSNKFRKYLKYSEELHSRISAQLTEKEDLVRRQLEKTMNCHLALAYNDNFKVNINSKYKIKVHTTQSAIGETLDKSTGQWLTIIFAFIASVMKMAKEISIKENPEDVAEYPLVLDAPFSTIDAKFVEKISGVLRTTSRQLIIFMNIKDSEVFLKSSSKFVGRRYNLKSNSTVETFVEEVR